MESARTNKPLVHSLLVLGKSLGSGAYGAVHEARWGNQACAAKTFFGSQSDFREQAIQKEISLLQGLRYRHVIQFYRTHEEDGRVYLLMELAEKGSLARAIAQGDLAPDDWATKKRLASEIARGLAFIHQEKVLHRDLKSANVLLTNRMEVKLADFGLAKVWSMTSAASAEASASGAGLKGTLRWIAPEILFHSNREYSTKSDVYALGVVMWEMAANFTRPFKDQENDALVALDVSRGCREQFPDNTPLEYRQLVEECWHQDPQQRPDASDVALLHDEPDSQCSDLDGGSTVDVTFILSDGDHNASWLGDSKDYTLTTKASQGDTEQYVGRLPWTNDDVVAYLSMSAKQGSADAQLFLGWIYAHGRGVLMSDKDSFWWYQQAAHQGLAVAQIRVGMMYQQGLGIKASDERAVSWYRRAADSGSAEAQCMLGAMYEEGHGVEQDDMEAVRWYRKAAEGGQREAQATLGQWYSLGRGVKQSDVEGAKWFRKAAEQGDVTAQVSLGLMYGQGQGVEQNDVEAVRWYTKAAIQGEAEAQCNLGWMYDHGHGVKQSDDEAVKWFSKAAVQGNATSQFNLGLMYEQGRGVEQSDAEAVKWFAKAAEQGNVAAQTSLGSMYDHGRGVEQSHIEAARWFRKAAEQGDATAQANLGVMYDQGQGVEQNDVEAVKWYTKAAVQGHAAAQGNLGWMYDHGHGVKQSDVEAVKWYTKSAEQWDAAAQFNIGRLYDQGRGVKQSHVEALKWYTKAAEQGEAEAQNCLGRGYDIGLGVDQSDHFALLWYSRSAEKENPYAQFNLASMYELGLEVRPDSEKAIYLFRKAAANGEPTAHFHIQWLTSRVYLGRKADTNPHDAVAVYRQGADQGYVAAQHNLGRMYEKGLCVTKDVKEAMEWYSRAAAGGHTDSKRRLAILQSREG